MDHPQQALVDTHQQRRTAALGDLVHFAGQRCWHLQALHPHEGQHRVHRALAKAALLVVDTRQPGLGSEGHGRQLIRSGLVEVMQLAQVLDNRLAFSGVVCQRSQQGTLAQLLAGDSGGGMQSTATAVAKGNGAGLVEHQHMHVTGRFHCTTGAGDYIQAHQAVHAGNADGRQQAANGSGDQGHQQRHQKHQRQAAAGKVGEGLQGHHDHQEDQREADQQDVQGNFVGGLLALGALDQGDHAVQGRLARVAGDADQQPVGHQPGVAGDRRTIAAGLADHRSGFTGNRRFVDRRNTFEHLAVTGDHLAGHDLDHIVLAQAGRRHHLETARRVTAPRAEALATGLEAVGAGLATTFGQGFGKVGEQHREPQPQGNLHRHRRGHIVVGHQAQHGGEERGQLHHQHHRRALQLTRIEFDKGLHQRRAP
ncbi:hypothetical protein D3C77_142260 [compost metagenome]